MPSLRARRPTLAASPFDSARKPWSMVTAINFGFFASASRQHAARTISAVESGPPETASTRTGVSTSSEKSAFASDAETASVSAMRTLLFLRDAAPHARGGMRKLAPDLGQGGAGRLF